MTDYYQITLWVTLEQEEAIKAVFAERRWAYCKEGANVSENMAECDKNTKDNTSVSNKLQPDIKGIPGSGWQSYNNNALTENPNWFRIEKEEIEITDSGSVEYRSAADSTKVLNEYQDEQEKGGNSYYADNSFDDLEQHTEMSDCGETNAENELNNDWMRILDCKTMKTVDHANNDPNELENTSHQTAECEEKIADSTCNISLISNTAAEVKNQSADILQSKNNLKLTDKVEIGSKNVKDTRSNVKETCRDKGTVRNCLGVEINETVDAYHKPSSCSAQKLEEKNKEHSYSDTTDKNDECSLQTKDYQHSEQKIVRSKRIRYGNIPGSIYCKECDHSFQSQNAYRKHLEKQSCRHECEFCGKIFLYDTADRYKVHLNYHTKKNKYECKICGKIYIDAGSMRKHFRTHTMGKRAICDQCGKSFLDTTAVNCHKRNMHNTNRQKFQCTECPRSFNSKTGFCYHFRYSHDTKSTQSCTCTTCGKMFRDKRSLKSHTITHTDNKNYKCNECNASFKRPSGLAAHKRRHAKAYTCYCKVCNQGFYSKKDLVSHERTHTGEKPYMCSACGYRCASDSNMHKHLKKHGKPGM